jgi:NAD(P)-dependent dehydrogenase (short-subunit alcohol dehydrogenase family)/uncharacterized protein YndB with AHSA1/START domain
LSDPKAGHPPSDVARNRTFIPLPPERVFKTLADPFTYQEWVVGTSAVRDADESYPEVGSRLYHQVGLGPLSLRDHSEVLELVPDRSITLDAWIRPVGRARVRMTLEPHDDGTIVLMEEWPADLWSRITMGGPLADPLLHLRNIEALSRFRRVTLQGGNPTDQEEEGGHEGPMRVLVTGGSSGIGLATAHRLCERGARIALVARGEEGLAEALSTFGDDKVSSLHTYSADISDREAITRVIDEAAKDLGGLDAVVANAASAAYGSFTETDPDDFDATIQNVLLGTVNTVRASLPHLERSGGSMVVVGSVAGRVPQPFLSAYSAAKHAVRGFLESLRAELRDDGSPVSLCEIAPWAIDTPLADQFESQTGIAPPDTVPSYRPEDVAIEIVESIERRRPRVIVGRRAQLAVLGYHVARPVAEAALVLISRYLRAGSDRLARPGGLSGPVGSGELHGPLPSRRSIGAMVSLGRQTVRSALDR